MSRTKTVFWFIAGITLGAAAGILLARNAAINEREKMAAKPVADDEPVKPVKDDKINGAVNRIIDKLENDAEEEILRDGNIIPKMNDDIM